MNTISKQTIAFITARIAYPDSRILLDDLKSDRKAELEKARKEYDDVFERINSDEIKEALDEAVGYYLSATIDYYCQLGVKQGIRFILDMISEGNENITASSKNC